MERRFASDSLWRRLWVVASDSTSDAFVEPRQIVVSGDVVVVLDAGTREVRGLDARTGGARFVIAAHGQGPGEFKRPSLLAATPSGFAVLDQANARLSAFDRVGRYAWSRVVDDLFDIDGLCVQSGRRVVAKLKRRQASLLFYDSAGGTPTRQSIAFSGESAPAPGFAHAAFVSDVSVTGECVVAPLFGAEWAVVPSAGSPRVFGLVEPGRNAVVTTRDRVLQRSLTGALVQTTQFSETQAASRGALVRGDTAIIYAAHTRRYPRQLLDYYSTRTGAYLFSRKLPFAFDALSIGADGTFYGTRIGALEQVVIAMRPERSAAPSQKAR
jgi:hypothetical protein